MVENKGQTFVVVANPEEQYSIWPESRDLPDGWVAVGPAGPKEKCLDYIERVWTDMRPRSLRRHARGADSEERNHDSDAEVRAAVRNTLAAHEDRVAEYAGGRPELFGWFLARVLETADAEVDDPDAVRAELAFQLPEVS